jgi:hypothetical protein
VRLERSVRHLAEADATVAGLVASRSFAGTSFARGRAALMADAGITEEWVIERKIDGLMLGLKPGELDRNRRKARRLSALVDELEAAGDGPPTAAQILEEPFLAGLMTHGYLPLFDPVRTAMKERALAWRYRSEAEAQRRRTLRVWMRLRGEAEEQGTPP